MMMSAENKIVCAHGLASWSNSMFSQHKQQPDFVLPAWNLALRSWMVIYKNIMIISLGKYKHMNYDVDHLTLLSLALRSLWLSMALSWSSRETQKGWFCVKSPKFSTSPRWPPQIWLEKKWKQLYPSKFKFKFKLRKTKSEPNFRLIGIYGPPIGVCHLPFWKMQMLCLWSCGHCATNFICSLFIGPNYLFEKDVNLI